MSAATVNYRDFSGVKNSPRYRPQPLTTAIFAELKISAMSAATVNYRDFGRVKRFLRKCRNRQLPRFRQSLKISATSAASMNYRDFGGVKKYSRCRPQPLTTPISAEFKKLPRFYRR